MDHIFRLTPFNNVLRKSRDKPFPALLLVTGFTAGNKNSMKKRLTTSQQEENQ